MSYRKNQREFNKNFFPFDIDNKKRNELTEVNYKVFSNLGIKLDNTWIVEE